MNAVSILLIAVLVGLMVSSSIFSGLIGNIKLTIVTGPPSSSTSTGSAGLVQNTYALRTDQCEEDPCGGGGGSIPACNPGKNYRPGLCEKAERAAGSVPCSSWIGGICAGQPQDRPMSPGFTCSPGSSDPNCGGNTPPPTSTGTTQPGGEEYDYCKLDPSLSICKPPSQGGLGSPPPSTTTPQTQDGPSGADANAGGETRPDETCGLSEPFAGFIIQFAFAQSDQCSSPQSPVCEPNTSCEAAPTDTTNDEQDIDDTNEFGCAEEPCPITVNPPSEVEGLDVVNDDPPSQGSGTSELEVGSPEPGPPASPFTPLPSPPKQDDLIGTVTTYPPQPPEPPVVVDTSPMEPPYYLQPNLSPTDPECSPITGCAQPPSTPDRPLSPKTPSPPSPPSAQTDPAPVSTTPSTTDASATPPPPPTAPAPVPISTPPPNDASPTPTGTTTTTSPTGTTTTIPTTPTTTPVSEPTLPPLGAIGTIITTPNVPNVPTSDVLVGKSTDQMRREAARLIASSPDHPLKFLLDDNNRLKSSGGVMKHYELIDRPDIVEMGHIISKKSGKPEMIMLQGAWENRFNQITVEKPRIGTFVENVAVDIGGIAVDQKTAKFWEEIGWLPQGTVDNAPRISVPNSVFKVADRVLAPVGAIIDARQFGSSIQEGSWRDAFGSGTSFVSGALGTASSLGASSLGPPGALLGALSVGWSAGTWLQDRIIDPIAWRGQPVGSTLCDALPFCEPESSARSNLVPISNRR